MVTIESLRLRALALRSSIHNEHQLSAIELTGMCAKKTNELIDVVNDLCDHVVLGLEYDPETETLYLKAGG